MSTVKLSMYAMYIVKGSSDTALGMADLPGLDATKAVVMAGGTGSANVVVIM